VIQDYFFFKENSRLDLLAIGSDTLILNRLLTYAASLSQKHVMHTNSFPLMASVAKDRLDNTVGVITG